MGVGKYKLIYKLRKQKEERETNEKGLSLSNTLFTEQQAQYKIMMFTYDWSLISTWVCAMYYTLKIANLQAQFHSSKCFNT